MASPTYVTVFNPITTLLDQLVGVDGVIVPSLGAASAGVPAVLNPQGLLDVSIGGTGSSSASQALINLIGGTPAVGNALYWNGTAWVPGTGEAVDFSDILSSTNVSAAMVVGTGASLSTSGSGTIAATSVPFGGVGTGVNSASTLTVNTGASIVASGSGVVQATQVQAVVVTATAPSTGQVLTATSATTAAWQTNSATPGGTPTQLQFNNSGAFGGAPNSGVSGTGAVFLGNAVNTPTSTTAFTVNASGGIAVSAQDWYSSNEGTFVASMLTSGRLTCNGVNIISNVSIGAAPALVVIGGNAGSPDSTDFITASSATPASTKTIWIDFNGNLNLGGGGSGGIKDHTGSLGTSGQALTSTGSQTLWASVSPTPGGSPTQIQYNLAGAFAGIAGSSVTAAGAVAIAPTGTGVALSVTGDAASSNILDLSATATPDVLTVDQYGDVSITVVPTGGVNSAFNVTGGTGNSALVFINQANTLTCFSIGANGSTAIQPQPAAATSVPALTVEGDAHGDPILVLDATGATGVMSVDQYGCTVLSPTASAASAALTVIDDGSGVNNIADFYDQTGGYNVVAIGQPLGGNPALSVIADGTALAFSATVAAGGSITGEVVTGFSEWIVADALNNDVVTTYANSGGQCGVTMYNNGGASITLACPPGNIPQLQLESPTSAGELLLQVNGANPTVTFYYGATGTNPVVVQPSPSTVAWDLTLPPTAGTAGEFLQTDGTGVTSWQPGGSPIYGQTGSSPIAGDNHTVTGLATLAAGTVTITLSGAAAFADTSYVVLVLYNEATTPANALCATVTSGTTFVITSSSAGDTANVFWMAVGTA